MKRIGKLADGMINALLTPDEYEAVRELPEPPTCMFCEYQGVELRCLIRGEYEGQWICTDHQDEAIGLLKARRQWQEAGCPKARMTTKTYRIVEEDAAKGGE